MSDSDRVVVSALIAVDPATAFAAFTEEVDAWWRRGPQYRASDGEALRFEPGARGRLVAEGADGQIRELARVLAWEPGKGRLLLEFTARGFDADQPTEVEVHFEAAPQGTRVTLEHRGFDAIPAAHPARQGRQGQALIALFGTWWGDLLVSLRQHAGG